MKSRRITIPQTITLEMERGREVPFSFAEFIDAILNMSEWGKTWRAVQAASEVFELTRKGPGEVAELHESVWSRLVSLLENPSDGYGLHPRALRQITPYFEAIFGAEVSR